MENTKVIAFADDLMVLTKGKSQIEIENYANIEIQKIATSARNNKITFNYQKSKLMVVIRRKPKIKCDLNIYLDNRELQQEDKIKYLGIIIHIEHVTAKCVKVLHALSKSAKINWGLGFNVLKII